MKNRLIKGKKAGVKSKKEKPKSRPFDRDLKKWRRFYEDIFSIELLTEQLKLPRKKEDFSRLVIIAEGLTAEQVFEKAKERFPVIRHYPNFDETVVKNERHAGLSYAILIRNGIESDRELADRAAEELAKKKIKTVTLLEHLVSELEYFTRTGKHLDQINITLCAGSRYHDGRVPTTISHKGVFRIHWSGSYEKNPRMRAQEIIAL